MNKAILAVVGGLTLGLVSLGASIPSWGLPGAWPNIATGVCTASAICLGFIYTRIAGEPPVTPTRALPPTSGHL